MKKAEWPERTCREGIPYSVGHGEEGIPMMASCELPEHLGLESPGPCATFSLPDTVARRDAWEARQAAHAERQEPVEEEPAPVKKVAPRRRVTKPKP